MCKAKADYRKAFDNIDFILFLNNLCSTINEVGSMYDVCINLEIHIFCKSFCLYVLM